MCASASMVKRTSMVSAAVFPDSRDFFLSREARRA
jgi:hypothetical protein